MLWNEVPQIYGLLSHLHQRELHDLYLPSRQAGFDEFELHLADLARTQPSLVSRVGKHFRRIERVYLALRSQDLSFEDPRSFAKALQPYLHNVGGSVTTGSVRGKRSITVVGVARPDVNIRQLTRALLVVADKLNREEKEQRQ
ncbi:MAG: hypothetical protein KKH51_16460 [Actinobacteria bacterium]|nr:hypothetical protein [Actinomycetota bacterium]